MDVTLKLKYGSYPVSVQFDKYSANNRTALLFVHEDTSQTHASINISHADVPDNDHIVVKAYSENAGMDSELVRLGLIQPVPVGFVNSGFITAPIHKLTPQAIALRDEQFHAVGI